MNGLKGEFEYSINHFLSNKNFIFIKLNLQV